jgi:hypothetical protein
MSLGSNEVLIRRLKTAIKLGSENQVKTTIIK